MSVEDEPGVLAKIAASFARYQVSIQAVRQEASRVVRRAKERGWRFSPTRPGWATCGLPSKIWRPCPR